MAKIIGDAKALMCQDKNGLINEAKPSVKQKNIRISVLTSHGQADALPSLGKQASSHAVVTWQDKCHKSECSPFLFLSPGFIEGHNNEWH